LDRKISLFDLEGRELVWFGWKRADLVWIARNRFGLERKRVGLVWIGRKQA
jgi:hypothetical protein